MKKIKTFTKTEKYNVCPHCGHEISLYMDDDGDYRVGCMECNDNNIGTFFSHCPTPTELEIYRPIWNIQALNATYSQAVLDQLDLKDGDYVVTNTQDNFIIYMDDAESMAQFLATMLEQAEEKQMFGIYRHFQSKFFNLGVSLLLELAWRYPNKK